MKIPITMTIDVEKKCLFESMKEFHGLSLSGFLDSALDSYLNEIAPLSLIEIKIKQHEEQIAEIEQSRLKANIAEEQLKAYRKTAKSSRSDSATDTRLHEYRLQKLHEYKDSTIKLWKKGDMNWNRIVETYQFKNAAEAKEWFAKAIVEIESGAEA